MKILNVTKADNPGEVIVRAVMNEEEYRRLLGHLDGLCVFAAKNISEPASVTRTGARHNRAKWVLVPKNIRKQFRGEDFDFEKVLCGAIEHDGVLCLVFTAPKLPTLAAGDSTQTGTT